MIMQYILLFLEGVITFISPCMLPMVPIYLCYFAGASGQPGKSPFTTLKNALGFILGFTLVFLLLGAAAGTFGRFLNQHIRWFNLIGGLLLVCFGLNYTGFVSIPVLNKILRPSRLVEISGFFSAFCFGLLFSIGWTPCVGAFLGSALTLAASGQSTLQGIVMLLIYSAGLGLPFLVSALLIDQLSNAFDWIKRHYRVINIVSGSLLIVTGIFMATGLLGRLLSIFS